MTTLKLDKPAWQTYFDRVSRTLEGKRAEIEVDSLELGSQIEADWSPLIGIAYDHKSDLIEIDLEGLDHLVFHPRELYVEHDATGLKSMEIIDDAGQRQIVKLRDPIMLPPP